MNKIYISDLDGTLLNENAILSDFTKQELNELIIKHNVNFTVASARNIWTINKMFEGVKLKLPVIEFNGSFITDIKSGEKLVINNIDDSIIEGFLKTCEEFGQTPMISAFNGTESNLYYRDNVSEGMDMYLENRRKINEDSMISIDSNDNYMREKIICFTLINKSKYLDKLVKKIENNYGNYLNIYYNRDIYYTDWHWVSIYSDKARKGNAIKELLKFSNMKDYELTVFGDHNNDIDMFKIANKAVAVSNGENQLKQMADYIIGSNRDDSVVKYIKMDIQI